VLIALLGPIAGGGDYLLFVALSAALAAATLGVGLLVSVWSQARIQALAIGIVVWFVLVLFYDLAAIGLALRLSSSGEALTLAVLGNPVEAARILAVIAVEPDLRVLGPLGSYLVNEVGTTNTIALLSASLLGWTLVPLVVAAYNLKRQDY
jgi:Cu-processing system permease protein